MYICGFIYEEKSSTLHAISFCYLTSGETLNDRNCIKFVGRLGMKLGIIYSKEKLCESSDVTSEPFKHAYTHRLQVYKFYV